MSIIKCFSVGNGDTYYIKHNSDNFTIIDCNLTDANKERIVDELISVSKGVGIRRFISTHPDNDHISGLVYLESQLGIENFYCVKNMATKPDETDDFKKYCELRDNPEKVFYIYKNCSRKWMNISDEERQGSGVNILWPNPQNEHYLKYLKLAEEGKEYNNISTVVHYILEKGVQALWMGDLEFAFMELIKDDIELPDIDILFAPHHGRDSGKVPSDMLKKMNPKLIVIGEAPSEHLNYYSGYNTITQNSAGDIIFNCLENIVDVYVSKSGYTVNFLTNKYHPMKYNDYNATYRGYYIGSLYL